MVRLLALWMLAHLVGLMELAGAIAIVAGLALAWGAPAALLGGGAFVLLKSFELDMGAGDES